MKNTLKTLLMIVVLMLAVAAGVYLTGQSAEFREKAAPSASLKLSTISNPIVGETFTVPVDIVTGTNDVSYVEMHIQYDQSKLEPIGVVNGSFFVDGKSIGPSINNTKGLLSYTVYVDQKTQARNGEGPVAIITFRAVEPGSAQIRFDSESIVLSPYASTEGDKNVLMGTIPAQVFIRSK